jgi:hypothetical protein
LADQGRVSNLPAVPNAHPSIAPSEADARVVAGESGSNWTRQAREIVDDLHRRSALIYWTDFLLSVGAAWTLAVLFVLAPGWGVMPLLALLAAAILFYRAGTFIHEIVHFRNGELKWFARAWNLLLGIPLLVPWILYRNHIDHHSVRYYGTPDDGEYLPLAAAPRRETLRYLLQIAVLPLFVVVRFGVLAPLSWLNRRLREWVLTGANSAGATNPWYRKRFPREEERHLVIVARRAWLRESRRATVAARPDRRLDQPHRPDLAHGVDVSGRPALPRPASPVSLPALPQSRPGACTPDAATACGLSVSPGQPLELLRDPGEAVARRGRHEQR